MNQKLAIQIETEKSCPKRGDKDIFMDKIEVEVILVNQIPKETEQLILADSCMCKCHKSHHFEDEAYSEYYLQKHNQDKALLHEELLSDQTLENLMLAMKKSIKINPYILKILQELAKIEFQKNGKRKNYFKNQDSNSIQPEDFIRTLPDWSAGKNVKLKKILPEEIKIARILKILNTNFKIGDIAKLIGLKKLRLVRKISDDIITTIAKKGSWTMREKWFYYLFRRNLGNNPEQLYRIFPYKKMNEVVYVWNRELSQMRFKFEFLIFTILQSDAFYRTDLITDLEKYLIRKPKKFDPYSFKIVSNYLRKRTTKFYTANTIEELFAYENLETSLAMKLWTKDEKGEKTLNIKKIQLLVCDEMFTI